MATITMDDIHHLWHKSHNSFFGANLIIILDVCFGGEWVKKLESPSILAGCPCFKDNVVRPLTHMPSCRLNG